MPFTELAGGKGRSLHPHDQGYNPGGAGQAGCSCYGQGRACSLACSKRELSQGDISPPGTSFPRSFPHHCILLPVRLMSCAQDSCLQEEASSQCHDDPPCMGPLHGDPRGAGALSDEKLPAMGKTPLLFSLRCLLKSCLYFWFLLLAPSCLVRTDPFTSDGQLTPTGGCHLLSEEVLRPPDKPCAATEPIPLWSERIPQPEGASWMTTRSPSLLQRLEVAPMIRRTFTDIP